MSKGSNQQENAVAGKDEEERSQIVFFCLFTIYDWHKSLRERTNRKKF